ncbi:hypothetical protein [Primorskyibacter sedentarius]|uniref:hypothetical protein n=1 Tax=Primorskyibacter sedentarius TaxID=745311 RepID=UPI003EBCF8D5
MTDDTPDAGLTPEQEALLMAYLDVSMGGSGRMIIDDMRHSFIERGSAENEAELDELYPHPYRAYVEIGERRVVQKILAAIAYAQQVQQMKFAQINAPLTPNDQETDL